MINMLHMWEDFGGVINLIMVKHWNLVNILLSRKYAKLTDVNISIPDLLSFLRWLRVHHCVVDSGLSI